MALSESMLTAIAPFIKGDVLSLGYPDLVLRPERLTELFGKPVKTLADNGAWHGRDYKLPETREFFAAMGARLTCVDTQAIRGDEVVADLNYQHYLGSFDLVIDPGTLEHCFNFGQAMINAAMAVKVGGSIFHCSPLQMMNHGFYNINPTLFHDFYTQNGWSLKMLSACVNERVFEVPETSRFRMKMDGEPVLYCIATRRKESTLNYPTQTKYLKNPKLKAA